MTDFIPPSEPGDNGPEGRGNETDPSSMPPTSNWGQAPRPANWGPDDGSSGAGYEQPGSHPDAYGDPYGGHAGTYGTGYVARSQASTALVLVIVGLFCCGLPAILGTIIARVDLNGINRGEIDPQNHGTAQAAFILGIIGSILWLAIAGLWLLATLVSIAASA